MNKQSKKIYSALINRIAVALLLNQGVMAILGLVLTMASGAVDGYEKYMLLGESVAYFLSFVIPIFVFNKMNNNAEKEIYEPRDYEKMTPGYTFFASCVALGGTVVAAYINSFLIGFFGNYSEFSENVLWTASIDGPLQTLLYLVYTTLIPAFVEEYLFRWTICKNLAVYGKPTAIIVSALLFSLMHANIEQSLYTFVAGVFFAWIYLETKNIAYPIVLHLINNGISAAGDIVGAQFGEDASEMYFVIADAFVIALALVSALVLAVHFKKKGRIIEKTVLKPDENGNEVALLSVRERISGFFSVGMVFYVIYSLIMTLGLIALSVNYG